jgi:methyl-accepting chemotaxis protein
MGDVVGVEEDADKLLAPAAKTYIASIEAMSHHLDNTVRASGDEQDRVIRSATVWLAILAAAAVCAGGLLAWVITRSVVVPLQAAIATTARVAAGDLSQDIDVRRSDEMGDLARSLASMTAQLRQSMGDVLESSQAIRNASSEIAAGNADLSTRTEQAASSLQQTASAMEQLTGTVQQSADAARQATQLASSAAEVAQRGGSMVSQVVQTMDDIQQSSRKIADIIGTIDGIAFQTNILALNAAVEAARAGEQGRGFAVVASEVRNLAQRAAGAAQQIKSLIGASVERVEAGSRMVADTGTTMQEIVTSVQRVADMISEISAAAAEQSNGIGQVNGSVSDLDRMTQQNSSLVEQSAAAADSMRQQAERLNALVVGFRL